MTSKDMSGSDITKASAELDSELEQIFEEMDAVLKDSSSWDAPADSAPRLSKGALEINLPDEFELPDDETGTDEPTRLTKDFERTVATIAPAADREILELELESVELERPYHRPAPPPPLAPSSAGKSGLGLPPGPAGPSPENELPEAEILPDDFEEGPESTARAASTVAGLSPQALSRLIEEAVTKGVLEALKRRGR